MSEVADYLHLALRTRGRAALCRLRYRDRHRNRSKPPPNGSSPAPHAERVLHRRPRRARPTRERGRRRTPAAGLHPDPSRRNRRRTGPPRGSTPKRIPRIEASGTRRESPGVSPTRPGRPARAPPRVRRFRPRRNPRRHRPLHAEQPAPGRACSRRSASHGGSGRACGDSTKSPAAERPRAGCDRLPRARSAGTAGRRASLSSLPLQRQQPLGACPACQGFGRLVTIDPDKVVPDPRRTLRNDAVLPFRMPSRRGWHRRMMRAAERRRRPDGDAVVRADAT